MVRNFGEVNQREFFKTHALYLCWDLQLQEYWSRFWEAIRHTITSTLPLGKLYNVVHHQTGEKIIVTRGSLIPTATKGQHVQSDLTKKPYSTNSTKKSIVEMTKISQNTQSSTTHHIQPQQAKSTGAMHLHEANASHAVFMLLLRYLHSYILSIVFIIVSVF